MFSENGCFGTLDVYLTGPLIFNIKNIFNGNILIKVFNYVLLKQEIVLLTFVMSREVNFFSKNLRFGLALKTKIG